MAGNKNSGRHGGPRNEGGKYVADPHEPSRPAPKLDGTIGTNQTFLQWIAEELAEGNIPNRTAEAMVKTAQAEQRSISIRHGLDEIDMIRKMRDEMQAARDEIVRREKAARYGAGELSTVPGRRKAIPDTN